MRKTLKKLLKDYFWTNLKDQKTLYELTQEQMGEILKMSKRTFAGIIKGRHSLGTLSALMYLFFLADDPHKELDRIQKLIFTVVDKDDPIFVLLRERKQKALEKQQQKDLAA